MTPRVALAVFAGVLVAADAALVAAAQAFRLRRTDRRWVRVGLARRVHRAWRARALSYWLWWAGWPHLVNVLLRTRRVRVMTTPRDVVWKQGRATLYRMRGSRPGRTPVLVVHAVVTRPWILDLLPDRSIVGALVDRGHDVYLLDWGDPGRRDARQGLTAHAEVLREVVDEVARRSPTRDCHVVGYCFAGTLALAMAAAWGTRRVRSLALVAPPVDTRVPGGMGALLTRPWLAPALLLDNGGCVPAPVVREAFHLLRPTMLAAARERLRRRGDRDFQQVAGALSRWAWEQRRVPGELFFDVVDLFRANALLDGSLRLGGARADLSRVDVPTLVLVTDRDHIVPIASSLALTRAVPHAEVVRCAQGHVSMLMGSESRTVLVPALDRWLRRS
ncbi:MAG TPA: alpha/beta fold hydrolase [Frankiaceae bacterium]|nr:alpha/beta fold hydrolase [Frankiaceae bacterium]